MLRAVRRIRRDAPGFLLECHRRWGPVVQLPIPRPAVYLVCDPDAVRHVLQDNHRAYDKATLQYRSLAAVTGNGLLVSDGEPWLRQRRLVQPAFHSRTLRAVADRTAHAAARQGDEWDAVSDGAVLDVDAAMMRVTLEVVGRALFRTDVGSTVDTERFVQAVLTALDVVVARARFPLPEWLPSPRRRRLRRSLGVIDSAVAAMVDGRRRRAGSQSNLSPAGGAGRQRETDLLDLLMAAESDGERMSAAALRDEVVTIVIAGHETVAAALTWAWHLLAGDPPAAERLHAEVDAVLRGEDGLPRRPAFDDLERLPWARAVVEEALRLYPPAWVVSRRATTPDVLAGHAVPAGALVVISPWVVHRDPGAWPDPERFDPGRFLPGRRDAIPRSAYLPFGAGPRLCVGRDFALTEATLVLATLASRYRFARVDGSVVRPDALVTVRPHGGLPLHLYRRP